MKHGRFYDNKAEEVLLQVHLCMYLITRQSSHHLIKGLNAFIAYHSS